MLHTYLLMKFRAGVSLLRIETGRYESNGSGTSGIPVHERICLCCNMGIEDERHFICDCPVYSTQRMNLKHVRMYPI